MSSRLAFFLFGSLLITLPAQSEQKPTKILIHGSGGTTTLELPAGWDPCPDCRNVDIWSFEASHGVHMKIDPIPLKNMQHRRVQEEFSWFDLHSTSTPNVVVELMAHAKAGKTLTEVLGENAMGMNDDFHQGVVTAVATHEAPWSDVKLDCDKAHCFGKQKVVSPDEKGHEVIGIVLLDPGPKSDIYLSFVIYSSKDARQLPLDLVADIAQSIHTTH